MGQKSMNISDNLLFIPITKYAIITTSLPAFSLAYCFLSAYFFADQHEINDTDCNVTNTIPSASAITGIKPQAYIWRICIGLHATPRYFIGIMYYNYYKNSLPFIEANLQGLYKLLMKLCFWLYNIECSCLLAVSCISNKENYPVHEKIFVAFMITSIVHMLLATILYRWSRHMPMTDTEKRSYFWKKFLLGCIIVSTVCLIYYFIQHRVYCVPGAFSNFSVFEYMVAYSNIGYHLTAYFEFSHKTLLVADLLAVSFTNGSKQTGHAVANGHSKAD